MPNTLPASAILIVDDDTELAAMLVRLLTAEGWRVSTAAIGVAGEAALRRDRYDVALLDVMLPDVSGIELCRRWREAQPELGILMLTARGDPIDRILGLERGADDYLSKPFEKRELVARLRALLRCRAPRHALVPASPLVFGTLRIDPLRREVGVAGQAVPLTSIEFKLLLELTRRPGRAVSRETLSHAVQAGGSDWIETVRGEGYAFVVRGASGNHPLVA